MVTQGFERYADAAAEIQRLHEIEFIHAGCAGLRERDNEHLIAERDRAREECGHEKAMRASQREEMMRYFNDWKAAEAARDDLRAAVDRVMALHRPAMIDPQFEPYCQGCYESGGEDGAPLWKDCPTRVALEGGS